MKFKNDDADCYHDGEWISGDIGCERFCIQCNEYEDRCDCDDWLYEDTLLEAR